MKKIMLHACCAPCASYPIEKLKEDNFEPVVFFYNPNIYPLKEYAIRRNELKNYCEELNLRFIDGVYEPEIYKKEVFGLEQEPEKGKRCSICFEMRLLKTAQTASIFGIDCFTTTLSVSPHKNSRQIFEMAHIVESQTGIKFIEYDFKKQDGFKKSRQIAREHNMYAQSYCGCKYSVR